MNTRHHGRVVDEWIAAIGLSSKVCGDALVQANQCALIYGGKGGIRAIQLRLGYSKLDSTVRYCGIEIADAHAIADGIDL